MDLVITADAGTTMRKLCGALGRVDMGEASNAD